MSEKLIKTIVDGVTGQAPEKPCCVCCGSTQSSSWTRYGFDAADLGESCHCGCCPCPPEGGLTFTTHACVTMAPHFTTIEESASYDVEWKEHKCEGNIQFDLSQGDSECYKTQAMAVENSPSDSTQWQCRAGTKDTWEQNQGIGPKGAEYTDSAKKGKYKEAWGYEGVICKGDITTPDRPSYSIPGECGGMGIIASLCCCRTGFTNNYVQSIPADHPCAPEFRDGAQAGTFLACPRSDHAPLTDNIGGPATHGKRAGFDCNMDCFTFSIAPNEEQYTYTYYTPVLDLEAPCKQNDDVVCLQGVPPEYKLETKTATSACSPCVYKYGECYGNPHLGTSAPDSESNLFSPSSVDAGTALAANSKASNTSQSFDMDLIPPNSAVKSPMGTHFIVSGQCHTDEQNFKLVVVGAWLMHCDCQTGYNDTDAEQRRGVFWKEHNNCRARTNDCDKRPVPVGENTATIPANERTTLTIGVSQPMASIYPCYNWTAVPVDPDLNCEPIENWEGEAVQCEHNLGSLEPNSPADPPKWASECEKGDWYPCAKWWTSLWGCYENIIPFDPIECKTVGWESLLPWKNGKVGTAEDTDINWGCWVNYNQCGRDVSCGDGTAVAESYGKILCREADGENTCVSMCEKNEPVIMWYTGIIQETTSE